MSGYGRGKRLGGHDRRREKEAALSAAEGAAGPVSGKGAITKAEYEKSLESLTEKMGVSSL